MIKLLFKLFQFYNYFYKDPSKVSASFVFFQRFRLKKLPNNHHNIFKLSIYSLD